ncbi:hypothetical protein SG34_032255 [Thalassomonas viridans]|uniref:Uncharacterized protein n=1 Tax=Thalassomonas viridans TaxID=137584 RepID=A0AAF0CD86_9GAMM|nr:hypothetical protein [Thalassomonas viridans]WDE08596.1 hypothetical protein SG34_032255 [Thalassomonas viridans]
MASVQVWLNKACNVEKLRAGEEMATTENWATKINLVPGINAKGKKQGWRMEEKLEDNALNDTEARPIGTSEHDREDKLAYRYLDPIKVRYPDD